MNQQLQSLGENLQDHHHQNQPQIKKQRSEQQSPYQTKQRRLGAVQARWNGKPLKPVQAKHKPVNKSNASKHAPLESKEPIQQKPVQTKSANTPSSQSSTGNGLPIQLQENMEGMGGVDLSDVKVNYNSSKPKQMGALAYAQGNQIEIGPGQEKHLPHEAWHAVQQKQGRVQANASIQAKGLPLNNDPALEKEADVMGEKALKNTSPVKNTTPGNSHSSTTFQLALDKDDYNALVQQVHIAVTAKDVDEEAVYVALQKLDQEKNAVTKLSKAYKKLFKTELVDDLRKSLSGNGLTLALELLNIKDDPESEGMLADSKPTDGDAFKALATKLQLAITGDKQEAVYALLIPFDRERASLTTLKSTYKTEVGNELVEDLKNKFADNKLYYALYLLNAPRPAADSASGLTIDEKGTQDVSTKVPGGNISVRTGDEIQGTAYDDIFSLEYKGGLASETRWLQFIWREIIATRKDASVEALNDSITTTGGTYNLTDDPTSPNYKYYEAGFASDRTADATTIYDMPSSADGFVQRELAADATQVVSRAHFDTFLIRDYAPLHHVKTDVEWTYSDASMPPRVQSAKDEGAVNRLPGGMKTKLVAQYPDYAYIR